MKVACFLNIQPSRNMPAPDLALRLDEAFALESLQCEGKHCLDPEWRIHYYQAHAAAMKMVLH